MACDWFHAAAKHPNYVVHKSTRVSGNNVSVAASRSTCRADLGGHGTAHVGIATDPRIAWTASAENSGH
jgi:hypothetical protein